MASETNNHMKFFAFEKFISNQKTKNKINIQKLKEKTAKHEIPAMKCQSNIVLFILVLLLFLVLFKANKKYNGIK